MINHEIAELCVFARGLFSPERGYLVLPPEHVTSLFRRRPLCSYFSVYRANHERGLSLILTIKRFPDARLFCLTYAPDSYAGTTPVSLDKLDVDSAKDFLKCAISQPNNPKAALTPTQNATAPHCN